MDIDHGCILSILGQGYKSCFHLRKKRGIIEKTGVENMKHIVIIATGGTIAGSGEFGKAAEYAAGRFSVEEILKSVPAIRSLASIQTIQLCNVDSNEINQQRWIELRNQIHEVAKDPQTDGIVVTHGTDTLEETAFFLNLTLHTDIPIVLTGSMRPATSASADGPMNLYQAVALAASDQAKGAGVLAVFSDTIYSGRDIRKTNSYKTDAFEIDHFGSLGYMRDDQVYFLNRSKRAHTLTSPFSDLEIKEFPKVNIAYWHCDGDGDTLRALCQNAKGLVIAGSGSGNYSQVWQKAIHELAKDHLIVRASRVPKGIVFDSAFFDPNHDTISAYTFPAHKARILLMLAMMKTDDKETIQNWFETL